MQPFLPRLVWELTNRAQDQANAAGETHVQPEHLLAVLLREPDDIAVHVLADLGAFPAGVAATRRGDGSVALRYMERALALDPGHEPTRQQVAALRAATGRLRTPESKDALA